jgi:hypothetical protein
VENNLDVISILTSIQKLKACVIAIFEKKSGYLDEAKKTYLKKMMICSDSEEDSWVNKNKTLRFLEEDYRETVKYIHLENKFKEKLKIKLIEEIEAREKDAIETFKSIDFRT